MNASINDINKAFAVIAQLTAADMLAIRKAAKLSHKSVEVIETKPSKRALTPEESRARKNDKQRALRATPEGRAYANAASKKSVVVKKQRAEAVKALINERIDAQKRGRR